MRYILLCIALVLIVLSLYAGQRSGQRNRECLMYGGELMADGLCHKMGERIVLSTDKL